MPESGQYSSLAEISGVQAGLILEQAEDEIIGYTRKAIASYGNTDLSELNKSQFSAAMYERCAKLQDYAIEAFRKRNDKMFRSVEASLISGFKAGVNDSNRQLGSSFSYNDYNKTIQGGKVAQSARQRLLQAEAKAVDDAVTRLGKAALAIVTVGAGIWGAHDLYSAFDKTYVADLGSGLIGLSTANGSQLALTGYAEGVVRESSHSMRLQGESAVAKDNGYSLVQIHTHNPCCNKCLPFNNVILVDDWFAEAQPDGKHGLLSKAIEQGLFHWNCRCVKRIYHEGGYIKYNDIGTDVKVLKGYELEQEMRRYERSIRGNKLAMQASLEIGTVNRCKEHIAYGQAQLRALTKFAKDNCLPVYRQNWREQIGGETKPTNPYNINYEIKQDEISLKPITLIDIEKIEKLPSFDGIANGDELRKLSQQLLQEAHLNNNDKEVGYIINSKNYEIKVNKCGGDDYININNYEWAQGDIFIHNHPRNSTFSYRDIDTFIKLDLQSMIVIGNNSRSVYALTKTDDFDIINAKRAFGKSVANGIFNIDKFAKYKGVSYVRIR